VCCSVSPHHYHLSISLQCVAVCCSVLQCVAVCHLIIIICRYHCSVLQCVAVCCSVLQCVTSSLSFVIIIAANASCAFDESFWRFWFLVLILACGGWAFTCTQTCNARLQTRTHRGMHIRTHIFTFIHTYSHAHTHTRARVCMWATNMHSLTN